jgi:hypothetical protein
MLELIFLLKFVMEILFSVKSSTFISMHDNLYSSGSWSDFYEEADSLIG